MYLSILQNKKSLFEEKVTLLHDPYKLTTMCFRMVPTLMFLVKVILTIMDEKMNM